jgi:hypothetical protein
MLLAVLSTRRLSGYILAGGGQTPSPPASSLRNNCSRGIQFLDLCILKVQRASLLGQK